MVGGLNEVKKERTKSEFQHYQSNSHTAPATCNRHDT